MKPRFFAEPPVHENNTGKTAVLLLNLGTPSAATAQAVRPYLAEFLADQRVVELSKWLWQPILRGIILPFRSGKSAHGYQKIWLPEGSPLAVYTQRLTDAVAARLPETLVVYAMTYGEPSVAQVMANLKARGAAQVLVIPLYPQYAASSSGAALDKVLQVLQRQRYMMEVQTVNSFCDDAGYISCLKKQIEAFWQANGRGDKLMMSFHGIPQAQYDQGDPYPNECFRTARALAAALGLRETDYLVSFQSRFGRAKWVGPSTQDLFAELPKQDVARLDVVCPAFVCDCLETMEEIAITGREQFYAAGGKQFQYIPCLNATPDWAQALADLAQRRLRAWA